jgi:hypothetical protein
MKIEIIFAFIIGFVISEIFGSQLLEPHRSVPHGGNGCSHIDHKLNKYRDCVLTGEGSGTKSHLPHTKVSGRTGKRDSDHPAKINEYYIKGGTWHYRGEDTNKTCKIYVGKPNNKKEWTCPKKRLKGLKKLGVKADCGGTYTKDFYRSKFMTHGVGCYIS